MKNFQAFICNMTLKQRIVFEIIGTVTLGSIFYLWGGLKSLLIFLGSFFAVIIIIAMRKLVIKK